MNKGILFIILSGLCFTVVNFFVKLLGTGASLPFFGDLQEYPGHELVLARSLVSATLSYIVIRKKKIPLKGNNTRWLLIRGLSGTIALTIFFYTIHVLPLAVASILQYLAPIFTVIFAIILLKEKVRLIQWLFIILSFSGVCLIVLDQFSDQTALPGEEIREKLSFFWMGMGLISAVFSGIAYTAIMKLKETDAPITIVFYFPIIAIPLMTILCFFDFTFPIGIEWFYLLIIGLFTQFAQLLLTKALHEGSASLITPFQYLGAIYAFSIGLFIFDETLSLIINIGMILTVSGVVGNAIFRKRR